MKESQGLVITLIVFIILTLALGVTSYFMAQGYKETSIKLSQAEEKASAAEGEVRNLNGQIDKLKEKIGHPAADGAALLTEMETDLQNIFGDSTEIPKSFKDAFQQLTTYMAQLNSDLAEAQRQRDEFRLEAERQETIAQQQKVEFEQQTIKLGQEFKDQINQANQRNEDLGNSYHELEMKFDTMEKEAKRINEEYRVQTADANETATAIAQINDSLRNKLEQMSQADFEIPDGKIIYVDQLNRRVRLNIGKAEGVRLLTNFSVFPFNAVELGVLQPKGSIEITRIIGDHESEARILSDEMLNPFMAEDIIFTPLWKKGDTVKIALDYFLDIDNDGKNDVETVMDLIHTNGSEVVVWVDDKGEMHGKLTPEVTYFIKGEELTDTLQRSLNLDQPTWDAIVKAHTELFETARLNSVREVRLPEFLRRVNYRSTVDVAKYQEDNGVEDRVSNPGSPVVSKANVAPIYVPGERENHLNSPALTAPIYDKNSPVRAVESPGKVSDFYFQKRNPGM